MLIRRSVVSPLGWRERHCESKMPSIRAQRNENPKCKGNTNETYVRYKRNLVLFLFNPQDPLVVTFKIYYLMDNESIDWQAPVRLGCPLVSSVFVQWDWWITCGKLPGVKCTQV